MDKSKQQAVTTSASTASSSSNSYLVRRRRNPAVLIRWIEEHAHNPYPTKGEKHYLALLAGMTQRQLNDWFANARRNIKKVGYAAWKKKHSGFSAILSGIPLQGPGFPLFTGNPSLPGFTTSLSCTPPKAGAYAIPAGMNGLDTNGTASQMVHPQYYPAPDQSAISATGSVAALRPTVAAYGHHGGDGLCYSNSSLRPSLSLGMAWVPPNYRPVQPEASSATSVPTMVSSCPCTECQNQSGSPLSQASASPQNTTSTHGPEQWNGNSEQTQVGYSYSWAATQAQTPNGQINSEDCCGSASPQGSGYYAEGVENPPTMSLCR